MSDKLPIACAWLLGLALALVIGPVAALGLGQIEVKSDSGEPLLAEIPIISSDPSELEQLQARLASPETFRRIGLEPPQGIVSGLQFAVALDAQGRPVVRVTSVEPVTQPLLTFLVEVDWGQGRLVREYSALIDTPESAVAIAQPPIQAPVAAPSNTIVRPPPAPVASAPPPPAPAPAAETPAPTAATAVPPSAPVPAPVAPAPVPAAPAPARTPATTPGELAPVQRGQTLSEIAGSLDLGDYSLNQTMLALLRANPDAFINDNINLVRQGAVLRVPRRDELARLSAAQANAMVRAQVRTWREAQRPPPQPLVAGGTRRPDDVAAASAGAAASDDARLEIVPPSGAGDTPGTRSGVSAGGEGEMLRNQLRQTTEDLAARRAEVEELRERVAELEQLQTRQQQLIELKDSELAAVQARLADSRAAGDAASGTVAAATSEPATAQPEVNAGPWLLGGVALLVLGALAWWLLRARRNAAPPPIRRGYDTEAMAAGLTATAARAPTDSATADEAPMEVDPEAEPEAEPESEPEAAVATGSAAPATDWGNAGAPTWHAGDLAAIAEAPPHVPPPGPQRDLAGAGAAGGRDGLELARAYMDLGDEDAARTLLREVLDGRDPAAREEAARMLRELG